MCCIEHNTDYVDYGCLATPIRSTQMTPRIGRQVCFMTWKLIGIILKIPGPEGSGSQVSMGLQRGSSDVEKLTVTDLVLPHKS